MDRLTCVNEKKNYWVYILHCEKNTYYTGYTDNLEKRYRSHMNGTGRCKYTRSFKPIKIAQCWKIDSSKSLAMKMEYYIKKLSHAEKEKIIILPSVISMYYQAKPISKQFRLKLEKLINPRCE